MRDPDRKLVWALTITAGGGTGREIGRYESRDDAMLAAEAHFESQTDSADRDGLGWQMGFNSATALSPAGTYRVRRI